MTVRMIEPPKPKTFTVKCEDCECKLEYNKSDVKTGSYGDYGGFTEAYSYIVCVNCDSRVTLKER